MRILCAFSLQGVKQFLQTTLDDGTSGVYIVCPMSMQRKPIPERSVRVNITLPPPLFQAALNLVRLDSYSGFADMVQALIRERIKTQQGWVQPQATRER